MNPAVVLDTGPLVALVDRRDKHHAWAREQARLLAPGLLTCEPVVTEACFLVRRIPHGPETILDFVQEGFAKLALRLDEELSSVRQLIARYAEVPMSLADACLVRMAELVDRSVVMTIDHDFRIYRKHRRQVIPVMMPPE